MLRTRYIKLRRTGDRQATERCQSLRLPAKGTNLVVDLNDRDAVVEYVRRQAAQGLVRVIDLVRTERDAMLALLDELREGEADVRIDDEEYSVSMILQHLNTSFARSEERLRTLSVGRPWVNTGPPALPGGLPEVFETDFARVRQDFEHGEDAILSVLETRDPSNKPEATARHAQYVEFNDLEWAVYSHHVHTADHVRQVRHILDVIRTRRL